MANFSDILPLVLPEVPQCPNILALNHIVRAARELCRESKVWNLSDTLMPIPGISQYTLFDTLDLPVDSEINRVTSLTQASNNILPADIVDMDRDIPGWRTQTSDSASNYVMENRRILRLYPAPTVNAVDNINISVSLRPTLTASTIDDDLYSDYAEAIAYGSLFTLMTIPNKEWSNTQEAVNKMIQFNYWIERATQDSARGYSDMEMIVRPE